MSADPSSLSYLRINKQSFPPRIAFCQREGKVTPVILTLSQMLKASEVWLSSEYPLNFLTFLKASNSFISLH